MMRKQRNLLFTVLLIFALVNAGLAKEVTVKEAKQVAKNFYYETADTYYTTVSYDQIALPDVFVRSYDGEPAYYIFNIHPDGFVVVSAEDTFNPILGYSLQGAYEEDRTNKVFENLMTSYAEKIDYLRDNNKEATDLMTNRWMRYRSAEKSQLTSREKGRDIEPLLTSSWDQNYPYNAYCPEDEDGPGGHVYAGCVATAMSMIMYHYKYPEHGYGQNSYYIYPYGTLSVDYESTYYMWDAMVDELSSGSPEYSIRSVAELQYHCGVAVNMSYAPDGSGSQSYLVPNAIKNHFGYSSDATFMQKSSYSLTEWQNMITEDLENNHPIYYSGCSNDGCHAFVLDGAQGSDMYHFNFGWSGYMNGYYYLEGSGSVGGYNQSQEMVQNFYPDQEEYPYNCSQDTVPYMGGTIDEGGMPHESYATDNDCSWLITPPSSADSVEQYTINFLEFDLENDADFVKVYDGPTTEAEMIGEYTGSSMPPAISSTSDSVLIEFISDDNETGNTGFRLEYLGTQPEYCDFNQFTEPIGGFTDGSGDMNYVNNTFCQFQITPPNANEVMLTFNEFDLAEGDNLKVYETNPTNLLAELTGSEIPDPLTSTSGAMMLVFRSDNMSTGQGFDVSYQIDNTGVEETAFDDLMVFPNPAKGSVNVRFSSAKAKKVSVSLTSVDGKQILQKQLSGSNGAFEHTIDIAEFDRGVYFLTLESESGSETRKLIIK